MKILPTTYKGILFRSRTEARWAVFFTEAGIAWNYEPEGHELESRRYLPDFYLPEMKLWFEVKPDETDGSERQIFADLVEQSQKRGIIAYGPPVAGRPNLLHFDIDGTPDGELKGLFEDRRDAHVYWLLGSLGAFPIGGKGTSTDHDRPPITSDRLADAFDKAAAERFGT